MVSVEPRRTRSVPPPPAWLFPATYVAHIVDEATFRSGFPAWFSATIRADLSGREFAWLNGIGLLVVTLASTRLTLFRQGETIRAVLATIVLTNGLLHVSASVLTRTLVPGVFTGGLLWVPLGAWSFAVPLRRTERSRLAIGIVVGLLAHAAVTVVALRL